MKRLLIAVYIVTERLGQTLTTEKRITQLIYLQEDDMKKTYLMA